jgi:hypothetical protein
LELARRPAPEAPWRLVQRIPNHWTPEALQAANSAGTARTFLGFSRFPAAQLSVQPDASVTVRWTDVRFTAAAPRTPVDRQRAGFFNAMVVLAPDGRILDEGLGR